MENVTYNKYLKCFICNGSGLIKSNNRFNKTTNFSYENRYKKNLLWVECPRCLGYGTDCKESGAKHWDKYHLSF